MIGQRRAKQASDAISLGGSPIWAAQTGEACALRETTDPTQTGHSQPVMPPFAQILMTILRRSPLAPEFPPVRCRELPS